LGNICVFFLIAVGTKFPASKLKEQEVRAYWEIERQEMLKMLDEYLFLCRKMGVKLLFCFFFYICYVIGLLLKRVSKLRKSMF